jgi:hypothetical protein
LADGITGRGALASGRAADMMKAAGHRARAHPTKEICMASPSSTPRPAEPTPARPAESRRPAHVDSALESLGKAITDPVRETADEADESVKEARRRAKPDLEPDEPEDWPVRSR